MKYLVVAHVASEAQGDVTRNDDGNAISVSLTVFDEFDSREEAAEAKEPDEVIVKLFD